MRMASTRLRGVLRGNDLGQPQIINLLPDERVKPGEKVITSGGDQIFPRGLPVGVVDRIVPDTANPPNSPAAALQAPIATISWSGATSVSCCWANRLEMENDHARVVAQIKKDRGVFLRATKSTARPNH